MLQPVDLHHPPSPKKTPRRNVGWPIHEKVRQGHHWLQPRTRHLSTPQELKFFCDSHRDILVILLSNLYPQLDPKRIPKVILLSRSKEFRLLMWGGSFRRAPALLVLRRWEKPNICHRWESTPTWGRLCDRCSVAFASFQSLAVRREKLHELTAVHL